jgi:hypothetical protein
MREEGALERQNIARLQLEKYAPSVHELFLPLINPWPWPETTAM